MKIARFRAGGEEFYAAFKDGKYYRISGDIFARFIITGDEIDEISAERLAPVKPGKIVCIGKNYAEHAAELGGETPANPIIFIKPAEAVIPHGGAIIWPEISTRVDYEAELAVVIGKKAKKVRAADAQDYIFGYTLMNDVTARDIQKLDGQWTRAKSCDTFAPLGPEIETGFDCGGRRVISRLNGKIMQNGNTDDMIWKVPELIEFVSSAMTLYPGDILSTGTPAGIGPMRVGDVIEVEIEGIGILSNTVKGE